VYFGISCYDFLLLPVSMPASLLIWLFLIYQSAFSMSLELFVLPPFNYFDIVLDKHMSK
jgi:hypothetical protein